MAEQILGIASKTLQQHGDEKVRGWAAGGMKQGQHCVKKKGEQEGGGKIHFPFRALAWIRVSYMGGSGVKEARKCTRVLMGR